MTQTLPDYETALEGVKALMKEGGGRVGKSIYRACFSCEDAIVIPTDGAAESSADEWRAVETAYGVNLYHFVCARSIFRCAMCKDSPCDYGYFLEFTERRNNEDGIMVTTSHQTIVCDTCVVLSSSRIDEDPCLTLNSFGYGWEPVSRWDTYMKVRWDK